MLFFCGYNGFGQINNSPSKIIRAFSEIPIEFGIESSNLLIAALWSRLLVASQEFVWIYGGEEGVRKLSFCSEIEQICSNEKFALILLKSGKCFKINLQTYESTELGFLKVDSESCTESLRFIACNRSTFYAITNRNSFLAIPAKVFDLNKSNNLPQIQVKQFVCGFEHFLILLESGEILSWGSGLRGQLGNGNLDFVEEPEILEALAGIKIVTISAGGWHSCAVSEFGDLYVWGWNLDGQLGIPNVIGTKKVFSLPEIVDVEDESGNTIQIENADCGSRHTIVKIQTGEIYGTGLTRYGQLGDVDLQFSNKVDRFVKLRIPEKAINNDKTTSTIVCGFWSTVVVVTETV